MGADFSRVRFNPLLDYAGVELEQGRVLLDADANELMAIVDRRLRALASDTLGRATVSSTTPDAFKITVAGGTLQIGKGRLYVDGLLAENHGAASTDPAKRVFDDLLGETSFADPIRYDAQPYLPNAPALPTDGRHLVYLDVWNREVTHLEQPDLIESAVGVDTSSRLQTVWQVRVLAEDAAPAPPAGRLMPTCPAGARSSRPPPACSAPAPSTSPPVDDPCELPPTGGYRGLENQLYRVEIHDAGQPGAGATFKWSRDNASVGSRVASVISGSELELETLGRDDVLRFNTGDWVEIIDDVREFSQAPGEMRRITVIEATRRIQFTPALPAEMLPGSFPDSVFPRAPPYARAPLGPEGTGIPHRPRRHAGPGAGPRRGRFDRRDRRSRGGHDAAAGKRRDGQLRVHGGEGISCRRLLGVRRAHGGRLGGNSRPRTAAAASIITMRGLPSTPRPTRSKTAATSVRWMGAVISGHICAINWVHPTPPLEVDGVVTTANTTPIEDLNRNGVLIAFDRPVLNGDIHRHSFMVLFKHRDDQSSTECWCELPINGSGASDSRGSARYRLSTKYRTYGAEGRCERSAVSARAGLRHKA